MKMASNSRPNEMKNTSGPGKYLILYLVSNMLEPDEMDLMASLKQTLFQTTVARKKMKK